MELKRQGNTKMDCLLSESFRMLSFVQVKENVNMDNSMEKAV